MNEPSLHRSAAKWSLLSCRSLFVEAVRIRVGSLSTSVSDLLLTVPPIFGGTVKGVSGLL